MDYEKLHKDTIKKLHQMVNSGKITVETACGICADFVSESEDERIRKDMIETIKKEAHDFPSSVIAEKSHTWIAWLEKQSKNNISVSEATKQELKDNLHKALEKETPESWNEFLDEQKPYGQRKECIDCQFNYAGECKGFCAMKRGEQKPTEEYNITDIGSKNAQGKLGEMIKNLKPVNKVLEQKPADKVEHKFEIGDWVITNSVLLKAE